MSLEEIPLLIRNLHNLLGMVDGVSSMHHCISPISTGTCLNKRELFRENFRMRFPLSKNVLQFFTSYNEFCTLLCFIRNYRFEPTLVSQSYLQVTSCVCSATFFSVLLIYLYYYKHYFTLVMKTNAYKNLTHS